MDKSILIKALNKYGAAAQEDICIEELSELIKAILKLRRSAKYHQYSINDCMTNLIEEIADVEICIEYLKLIHEQTNPDFKNRIDKTVGYKLKRLKNRMEKKDENIHRQK